jgi:hypothetical protein
VLADILDGNASLLIAGVAADVSAANVPVVARRAIERVLDQELLEMLLDSKLLRDDFP